MDDNESLFTFTLPPYLRYSEWAIGRQIIGRCQCIRCYREYCASVGVASGSEGDTA